MKHWSETIKLGIKTPLLRSWWVPAHCTIWIEVSERVGKKDKEKDNKSYASINKFKFKYHYNSNIKVYRFFVHNIYISK